MVHQMRGAVLGSSCMAWEMMSSSRRTTRDPPPATAPATCCPHQATGQLPQDEPRSASTAAHARPGDVHAAEQPPRRRFVKSFLLAGGSRAAARPLIYTLPRSTALRAWAGCRIPSRTKASSTSWRTWTRRSARFRLKHMNDMRASAVMQAAADAPAGAVRHPRRPRDSRRAGAWPSCATRRSRPTSRPWPRCRQSVDGAVQVTRVVVRMMRPHHQPGRPAQPDRGQRDPGYEPHLEGAGDLDRRPHHQHHLADRRQCLPVIHFDEVPARIDIVLIDQPNEVPGRGEAVIGTMPAPSATPSSTPPACASASLR